MRGDSARRKGRLAPSFGPAGYPAYHYPPMAERGYLPGEGPSFAFANTPDGRLEDAAAGSASFDQILEWIRESRASAGPKIGGAEAAPRFSSLAELVRVQGGYEPEELSALHEDDTRETIDSPPAGWGGAEPVLQVQFSEDDFAVAGGGYPTDYERLIAGGCGCQAAGSDDDDAAEIYGGYSDEESHCESVCEFADSVDPVDPADPLREYAARSSDESAEGEAADEFGE